GCSPSLDDARRLLSCRPSYEQKRNSCKIVSNSSRRSPKDTSTGSSIPRFFARGPVFLGQGISWEAPASPPGDPSSGYSRTCSEVEEDGFVCPLQHDVELPDRQAGPVAAVCHQRATSRRIVDHLQYRVAVIGRLALEIDPCPQLLEEPAGEQRD